MSEVTTPTENLPVLARVQKALGFTAETEKTLRELAERTKSIVKITDEVGYEQVHRARMTLKNQRLEITKRSKDAREDATIFSKGCINEEKRLIGIIEPEEERLYRLQKEVDDAKEREKQARIEAEKARVSGIQRDIEQIRMLPTYAMGKTSSQIQELLDQASKLVIGEAFAEFTEQAISALNVSTNSLYGILKERQAWEAEQVKLKEERAELERLRAEAAARKAAEDKAREEEQRAYREANERNVAAWQEIQAITHQLLIADTGRAPYIQGGTVEGIELLISETEEWEVTVDKFGMLLETAERAKEATVAGLRAKLTALQAEIAAQAERDKADQEAKAIAEKNLRAAEIEDAALAEEHRKVRDAFEGGLTPPSAEEMVQVLAEFYGVSEGTILTWIMAKPSSVFAELQAKAS